ncbi:MAG: methyl-accepting chemotaxis protein [Gemmatimonadetes bacterium]|nr:methyl-accepting chemotaxis protein [Gemmatimonadota bacterium]
MRRQLARLSGTRWLSTLRGRLILSSFVLVGLIAAATWIGYATVEHLTREIGSRFSALSESTRISTEMEDLLLTQMVTAEAYIAEPSPRTAAEFEALGRRAHELRQAYRDLPALTAAELTQIAIVEDLHSTIEVEYSLAHALLDIGREGEALVQVEAARPRSQALQTAIRKIGSLQAAKVAVTAVALDRMGDQRSTWLLVVCKIAVLLVMLTTYFTRRWISAPLARLTLAAEQIGAGDLRVQMEQEQLQEFSTLAGAFGMMATRLQTLVSETAEISEQIAVSASDLSSISEEVAASSEEVATAMVEITRGAESQSYALRETTQAIEEMGRSALEISAASQSVTGLGLQIQEVAARSRSEVSTALRMLLEVREVVQHSGREITELEQSSAQIDRFVETITGIARQTNLLALNAAIEAARAGEHGRGFAVVADEVRKLAEGSAQAAREVALVVHDTRAKIKGVVSTIERGKERVAGVEEVSRSADQALEQIITAVDGVCLAADRVAGTVTHNYVAIQQVERVLSEVSGTAESHAASAEEVSAAAEEQSAATQEFSATSVQLLHSAERMKLLVSGLQV